MHSSIISFSLAGSVLNIDQMCICDLSMLFNKESISN